MREEEREVEIDNRLNTTVLSGFGKGQLKKSSNLQDTRIKSDKRRLLK